MTIAPLSPRRMDQLALKITDEIPGLPKQAAAPHHVGWLIFFLIFLAIGLVGGLGSWAALAPMQSAVQAPGKFGVLGNRLVIQHLEGGIVRKIAVLEGQKVQKGDVIAKLDDTRSRASLLILQNQLAGALATDARLQAELSDSDNMIVPADLTRMIQENPHLHDVFQVQRDLFAAKRRLLTGRIDILLERTAQLERQRDGILARMVSQSSQLSLLQDDLQGIGQLVKKGLATRSRLLSLRLEEAELLGDFAISRTDLQSIDRGISEQKENQLQVARDALTETAIQRQEISQSLNDLRQRLAAAVDVHTRTTISAPDSGSIIDLRLNTLGQVIAAGQEIAEILPDGTGVAVDVRINPDDIDQVQAGGTARIRLTAYNMRTTPTVSGHVVRVSPDSLTDAQTGQPYYHALIELDAGALDQLPEISVLPGMQAQVMIATGEQTLVDYLLSPIIGGMEIALSDNM